MSIAALLRQAAHFIANSPGSTEAIKEAAVGLVTLMRTLVETRGVDDARALIEAMIAAPASKVDLSDLEREVEEVLAARRKADSETEL